MKTLAPIVAFAAVGVLMVPGAAHGSEPSAVESFAIGQSRAHEGRWREAYLAFRDAWSRAQSPEFAAALGDAELRLGRPVPAAEHLSMALARMSDVDPGWPDALFDLVEARHLVTTIRISTDHPGAMVFVDETFVGRAPLERPVFVEFGPHVIRVRLDGFVEAEKGIQGRMGAEVDADFALVAETSDSSTAPSPVASAPPPRVGRNPWVIAGGAVAGGATLAVGIGYGVAAVTSEHHDAQRSQNAGIFGTVGGAVLAATVVYALWPSAAPSPGAAHTTVAPVAFDKGGGIGIIGAL